MKRSFVLLFILLTFFSCRNQKETPLPETENPDWYILHAPKNREIQSVYGDIDGTVLITDRFRIYYTKDKGKTWNQSDYDSNIGITGFARGNDTLFALNTEIRGSDEPGNRYAIRPYYFSVDGGIVWTKLRQLADTPEMRTPLNYWFSGKGIRFSIDQVFHSNGTVEDIGIKTENGRKITFPQHHIFTSVYFDKKSRLYVSGSAPLCDVNGYVQLCDKENLRGTLYISKNQMDY